MDKKKLKREIDFKYNLKEYLRFVRPYKWIFFIMLFLSFLLSASSAIEKFIFKEIIDKGTSFESGTLTLVAYLEILKWMIIIFGTLVFLRVVIKWFIENLSIKINSVMAADLKRDYFNHIVGLSHRFHTTHKTGSLISRIGRGANSIERMNEVVLFNISSFVFAILVVVGSLVFINYMSAIALLLTTLVFIGYSVYLQERSKPLGAFNNQREDIEKGNVADFMINVSSIKYFGKERLVNKKMYQLTEETKNSSVRLWSVFKYLDVGQSFILGVGLFFLIFFPMKSFLAREISLGSIVFIYTIYGNVVSSLFGFVQGLRGYYRSMTDFEDLFQYGKIKNDIKDNEDAANLMIRDGEVEFKNVSFRYHDRRGIFKNFNLKIPANKKIALVGHSGCGKSTLVNLLYRFYDVEKGRILIDGKDIKNFKQESVRSEMAIVPQEAVLFDDTLYNNVKFSKPNASRSEVMNAIKFAQLDKTLKDMPKKEHTIVGERGVKLSGGEKQRVSIARAILANKKILVLDEATSSLDSETEHEIQRDLKKLMEGRTSIIIAHRLSTIMHADMIVVMKDGKIVQTGNHEKLIAKDGEYKKLWNLQRGGYIK